MDVNDPLALDIQNVDKINANFLKATVEWFYKMHSYQINLTISCY